MKHLRLAALGMIALATPVSAQELKFEFRNPSFGGNPFNSDHLLATATAQRPPQKSSGADGTGELTEAQLFARQIQSRLLSALSSSVVEAITGSDPGTSGEFTVGDQKISFERTLSEIRLSIFDNSTGETTDIVVPVLTLNTANAAAASSASANSVESSLAASLAGTTSLTGQ
ncbi:curli assembly protein CsgF [Sphingobium tyrosinilyticum]|uniref:Curli production assembly/transport component CsgF n=1 Tax=Sphingobium tyrosinilyticum TaxID=2715436 RepID=A0ABV9EYE5_9SPHN